MKVRFEEKHTFDHLHASSVFIMFPHSLGFYLELRYSSWPVLGLTTISPEDMQRDGYPLRAEWCGKSVCIGGEFQAVGDVQVVL